MVGVLSTLSYAIELIAHEKSSSVPTRGPNAVGHLFHLLLHRAGPRCQEKQLGWQAFAAIAT